MVTVTTVIPTRNRRKLLERAVASVMAQTFPDWECVIVGDDTDAESVSFAVGLDSRFRFVNLPRQVLPHSAKGKWAVGGVDAFNHGLDLARGEWVAYLADDDEYLPNHHADLLAGVGDADIAYGQSKRPAAAGYPDGQIYGQRWPADPLDIVQGSYIMRRSLGLRADATFDGHKAWDAHFWTKALAVARVVQVRSLVHIYHAAPETLGFHAW